MTEGEVMQGRFKAFQDRMEQAGLSSLAIRTFASYFEQVEHGATGLISSSSLSAVEELPSLESIGAYVEQGRDALSSLLVIKLNGGLGTSMGLDKAKSLLPVKEGFSFLDIICKQVLDTRKSFGSVVPLVFMNSFRTDVDTLNALEQYPELHTTDLPLSFVQGRVPKIETETLAPFSWETNEQLEWCPPGHGDIYTALLESGYLERAINSGYRYAFVSNSDNLGANLDLSLLGFLASKQIPFLMEVADRTAADRKGGHLARDAQGRLLLREFAQCPKEDREDFQDYKKYCFFNTNSLWIDLVALQRLLDERKGILGLPLIRNEKPGDPRDESSPRVYQLETAMGTAISCFARAQAVRVPRSRFLPVKTTNDLLELWSDRFELDKHYRLQRSPHCSTETCLIHLDPRFFKKIDDFEVRFRTATPSLLHCRELTIEGDIAFAAPVSLHEIMSLCNNDEAQKVIQSVDDFDALVSKE